jgi:hypothetical protein
MKIRPGQTWHNSKSREWAVIESVDAEPDIAGRRWVHYSVGPGTSRRGQEVNYFLEEWRRSARLARWIGAEW